MNPNQNNMGLRDVPPPPNRPLMQPNAFGGNPATLPAPMLPQYVF